MAVIEVVFLLRDVLTKLSLKSFPKVSGSKGIQLYAPLNTRVSYSATQLFAKTIAELLEGKGISYPHVAGKTFKRAPKAEPEEAENLQLDV